MGLYAAVEHIPGLRATGRAEVVAAARRDPERLALAKRELSIPQTFTNWREMLEKVQLDAVVVATPHNYHREVALTALECGLHVLLEKPLATTITDARAILQATRKSDRVVMMGVNRRGEPSWKAVQRALACGEIGQVRQISGTVWIDMRIFREEIPMDQARIDWLDTTSEMIKTFTLDVIQSGSWRRSSSQIGGDFFADVGPHLVDVMLWMGGAPPVEVLAYSPRNRPQQASIMTIQALLRNDVILSITFNDNVAMGDTFNFAGHGQIMALGDRGRLTGSIGWGAGPAENLMIERNGVSQPLRIEGQKFTPAEAFVNAVLDGAPTMATVEDAAWTVAIVQSAYHSAAERQVVKVEDITEEINER
jgi:predicted dehydrogenase